MGMAGLGASASSNPLGHGHSLQAVAQTPEQRLVAEWLDSLPQDHRISLADIKAKFGANEAEGNVGMEAQVIEACNFFQENHYLVMLTLPASGEVLWVKRNPEEARALEGATQEQLLVFQEVRKAGQKGIYKKDLKRSTGIVQGALTRALRSLETRKLVKAVKTIASKTMNLYVTYDVTPLREHTGGPWYEEQEFDSAFVEQVSSALRHLIQRKENDGGASLIELHQTLMDLQATKQELEISDLRSVLQTLYWDGKIELHRQEMRPLTEFTFDSIRWQTPPPIRANQFTTETPCGGCPVRDKCTPYGGVVSPMLCKYMDTWNGSDGILF